MCCVVLCCMCVECVCEREREYIWDCIAKEHADSRCCCVCGMYGRTEIQG